jgi:GNAT superfamily N-acetyltransferase
MEVIKKNNITMINSHLPSNMFNIVYTDPQNKIKDHYIDDVINVFGQEKLPFAWWVDVQQTPQLPALLKKHALLCDEVELGMAIQLSEHSLPFAKHTQLEIVKVDDLAHFSDWMSVFSQLLPAQQNVFYIFISQALLVLFEPDCPFELFIGHLNGMPVSTCGIFYSDAVAGIFDMITLPKVQRQGIATTMMTHAMQHAQQKGYDVITLSASDEGRPVYEKLGFKPYTHYEIYVPSMHVHGIVSL